MLLAVWLGVTVCVAVLVIVLDAVLLEVREDVPVRVNVLEAVDDTLGVRVCVAVRLGVFDPVPETLADLLGVLDGVPDWLAVLDAVLDAVDVREGVPV